VKKRDTAYQHRSDVASSKGSIPPFIKYSAIIVLTVIVIILFAEGVSRSLRSELYGVLVMAIISLGALLFSLSLIIRRDYFLKENSLIVKQSPEDHVVEYGSIIKVDAGDGPSDSILIWYTDKTGNEKIAALAPSKKEAFIADLRSRLPDPSVFMSREGGDGTSGTNEPEKFADAELPEEGAWDTYGPAYSENAPDAGTIEGCRRENTYWRTHDSFRSITPTLALLEDRILDRGREIRYESIIIVASEPARLSSVLVRHIDPNGKEAIALISPVKKRDFLEDLKARLDAPEKFMSIDEMIEATRKKEDDPAEKKGILYTIKQIFYAILAFLALIGLALIYFLPRLIRLIF